MILPPNKFVSSTSTTPTISTKVAICFQMFVQDRVAPKPQIQKINSNIGMGGRNDKGKKKAIEKPKKPKRRLLIPVPRMNAHWIVGNRAINSLISKVPSGFSKSKARTFSGRNPTVPIQQPEEDSESDGLNESDEMNNAEVSDDEMELDDNIEN
ncbi:hypothetical protein Leryth_016520 [Lithospermum erythrorhizon]|nr:hypothetical protein Leryth_016520 [Lithospermum erythrorhizon]